MLIDVIAWILIGVMSALAVFWLVAGSHMARSSRDLPHVRDALDHEPDAETQDADWPRVSIILPTHNEESMLDACLRSVRAQDYPNLQIIIALDRCEDQSPAIAQRHADEDPRITVTANVTLRAGWRGKCLPMQVGSEHADGDWLLFIDADTELEPTLVRAAVFTAQRRDIEMLSVLPDLRCRKIFEHIAQPVASLNMMYMFPPRKVNRPNGSGRAFSLGAFSLLKRERYDQVGGMAAVKDQFMEDINLARVVNEAGGQLGIASGTGMFRCVMYDRFDEFMAGWKRIFIGSANQRVTRLRRHGRRLLALGLLLPLIQLTSLAFAAHIANSGSPALATIVAGCTLLSMLCQFVLLAWFYRAAGASPFAALLFPAGAAIVGIILGQGANDLTRGRAFNWGGHDYLCEAR